MLTYINDYLYSYDMSNHDYNVGYKHYKSYQPTYMACSAVRKGNYIGRNLDWKYDDHVEVLVRTRAGMGRYATIGLAHTRDKLTDAALKNYIHGFSGITEEDFKVIPFQMADCLNEKHVYASMNVVPNDKPNSSIVGTTGPHICQLMLPRYICDYAATADEAVELLRNVIIFSPVSKIGDDCHLLVADEDTTYVVEFVDGELKIFEQNYITNFHLDGWNGTIATKTLGYTDDEITASGLTDHAMGLERYKIIEDAYDNLATEADMIRLMKSLYYTKAYDDTQEPYWYSEFYGTTAAFGDKNIYSTPEEMADIVEYAQEHYIPGKRDGQSWNTCHMAVYDLHNLSVKVYTQESQNLSGQFKLDVKPAYGILGVEELFSGYKTV